MERRTRVTHSFQSASADAVPVAFTLIRTTSHEARRTSRELWRPDTAVTPCTEHEVIATFTRYQLAELISDAVGWLAYTGEDG